MYIDVDNQEKFSINDLDIEDLEAITEIISEAIRLNQSANKKADKDIIKYAVKLRNIITKELRYVH